MRAFLTALILLAAVPSFTGSAQAVVTFYTDRDAFLAAAGAPLFTESFESAPAGSAQTFTFDGFSVSETGDDRGVNLLQTIDKTNTALGSAVTDGNKAVMYKDQRSVGNFFDLNDTYTAFGLDVAYENHMANRNFDLNVEETDGTRLRFRFTLAKQEPKFVGVIAPKGLKTISITPYKGAPLIGFDNVAYGLPAQVVDPVATTLVTTTTLVSSAPEPATWVMMILGFGLVALRLKRRSAQAAAA